MTGGAGLDGDQLIAERLVAADQRVVWQAFTTPEHLAAFWGGRHATVRRESVVVDLAPGGGFELETHGLGGAVRTLRFVYEVIDEPTLLVFTEPTSGIVTNVRLRPHARGTVVTIHQRCLPPELRTEQASSGLMGVLDHLDTLVRRLREHRSDQR